MKKMGVIAKMSKATSGIKRSSAVSLPNSAAASGVDHEFSVSPNQAPPVKLTLGDTSLTFSNGTWETDSTAPKPQGAPQNAAEAARQTDEILQLRTENEGLKSEVNLLKFKVELLLDMVTLANLDCDKLSEELEQGKKETSQG
uniref:Uncharacterized protein n=1 Tax=Strombidinopsis acuminata TaxID=141414 RepID=A0A7S3WYQ2_9SPIT|mmetsp:Transcript_3991/g.12388  ORF Transcript_3991/g.12388 Transcript_3991/m.12388 type:complete len:143 (+) Transcript_3991:67-495(+)